MINLETKQITLISDFLQDPSYKYFAYNSGKFYAANESCIKIAAVKLSKFKAVRNVHPECNVGTIQMWDSAYERGQKVHGLAVCKEGRGTAKGDDFIYVFVEVFSQKRDQKGQNNRISMNKLYVKNHELPPYEFKYYFSEAREYIQKKMENATGNVKEVQQSSLSADDYIEKYSFIFNKSGIHAGLARRNSGHFDLYYDGNWVDDAPLQEVIQTEDSKQVKHHACVDFVVSFDGIYLEMAPLPTNTLGASHKPKKEKKKKKEQTNVIRMVKHGRTFDTSMVLTGSGSMQKI